MKRVKNQMTLVMSSLLLVVLSMLQPDQSYAGTTAASSKATATIPSACIITAQNISFGNLVLPISAQTASSTMTVLCSNKASYTVSLAYGGIYGLGGTNDGNYWVEKGCGGAAPACYNDGTWYFQYNASGTLLKQQEYNWQLGQAPANTTGPYQVGGSYPEHYVAYGYGLMTGVALGDHIGYFIAVPGGSNVWNAGESNYTATGIGSSQSINMKATLVPAQSTSAYPSPDSYMDTVTATVSY